MAEAAISFALENLVDLLVQEAETRFLSSVIIDRVVEGLRNELGHLQSLLKEAEQKKQIRRLAYRAEDVVEEYVVKAGTGNGDQCFTNILKILCFANKIERLHNVIGSQIKIIKSEINNLTGGIDMHVITQEETFDEDKRYFIRNAYPHEELEHFIWLDSNVENIVSLLVSDQESRHRVIGVWGMGGSGKTTVVKKVYKHIDVRRFFDSFAWVCITQNCQIQSVMQDIFRQFLPAERKKDTIDELVEQITRVQMEKKCLIVVDDIWKLDDWEWLSKCFPNVGSHSKVLLTTRFGIAAEIGYPVELKGSTEDEAWELLRMKAFAKFEEPSDDCEYKKLGRTMIRKCGCMPLAIAVLGGILSSKNSLKEWELASDDVNSYIGRGQGTEVQEVVEKVLALGYDELPYHLKACFLSLGFLQEDECASVDRIYDLWMAEGLIQSEYVGGSETMRDVARCYLYELHFRSMVQLDHDLSTLSLNDSILDLCRSKANEEEFCMVVDKSNISEKAYRLVVHVDHKAHDWDILKAVYIPLRSLQIVSKGTNILINLPKEIFHLKEFKSLRVLIVSSCHLKGKFFHRIKNLIHLRLLGLTGCEWERFSLDMVDKLFFLQTLDLTETKLSLTKLPFTFCKMQMLRHLYLPLFPDLEIFQRTFIIEGKLMRLKNLPHLETLYNFRSKIFNLEDLYHLKKLRTLRCWVDDDKSLEFIINYIWERNLRWVDISIKNCDLVGSYALKALLKISVATLKLHIESCILFELPQLESTNFSDMCPGLVYLDLGDADIAKDVMPVLDKFPNLKKLRLRRIRFSQGEMICDAGSFPQLEQLYFYRVVGKFELRVDEAAMPNLSSMQIVLCSGINFTIPERLRCLLK